MLQASCRFLYIHVCICIIQVFLHKEEECELYSINYSKSSMPTDLGESKLYKHLSKSKYPGRNFSKCLFGRSHNCQGSTKFSFETSQINETWENVILNADIIYAGKLRRKCGVCAGCIIYFSILIPIPAIEDLRTVYGNDYGIAVMYHIQRYNGRMYNEIRIIPNALISYS